MKKVNEFKDIDERFKLYEFTSEISTEEINEWKTYKRTNDAEMRPVTKDDIKAFDEKKEKLVIDDKKVSISQYDILNGSPRSGDMIARNPEDWTDQWLVNKKYFKKNFKEKTD